MSNLYYCYLPTLNQFIQSKGLNYISEGVSEKNNKRYFAYEKCDKLNDILIMWKKYRLY